jgi:hypothetical protein
MKKNYLLLPVTVLFFISLLNAQVAVNSQWTWVSGDNIPNQPNVYGTKGVPASTNKPGRRTNGASWTDNSGNLWFFGGYGTDYNNDLWKYDIATTQWTWMHGDNTTYQLGEYGTQGVPSPTTRPGARTDPATWKDADGNFWLYGGTVATASFTPDGGGDLWKYDVATNQWTWISGIAASALPVFGSLGVTDNANTPGSRAGSATWTDANGKFWLFGGYALVTLGLSVAPFSDLWKYDPITNQWTWMNGPNIPYAGNVFGTQGVPAATNSPAARGYCTTWKDANGKFWLFGGVIINSNWNDLWKYDPVTNQWAWMKGDVINLDVPGIYGTQGVAAASNNPGSRFEGTGWADAFGNLWLFGGAQDGVCTCNDINDLWRYNIAGNHWTWMKGDNTIYQLGVYGTQGVPDAANKPGARHGSFNWSDANGNLWLYGGRYLDVPASAQAYLSDLWKISACTDPNPPKIKFQNISVVEGDAGTLNAVFTLELSKLGSCKLASVDFTTQDGTAIAGQDYIAVSGTATFSANSTTTTVTVPIIGDLMDEKDNEYFTLELSNPVFATLGATSRKCIIEDNDPEPTVSINDVTVYEDAGQAVLTISLSGPSGKDVKVKYKTFNGSAVQPQDYTKTHDETVINAGSTSVNISVPIIADNINEPTENLTVELTNAKNAGIGDGIGVVTILNGNAPAARMNANSFALKQKPGETKAEQFNVRVLNNPSPSYFELHTESNSSGTINVRIVDANGRLIELMKNVSVGQSIKFGNAYKQGIYFAEVVQGQNRKVLKLVKL